MTKNKQLKWTSKQKEIAALAEQGKGSAEIIATGYTSSQVFAVLKALKERGTKEERTEDKKKTATPKVSTPPKDKPDSIYQTRYKIDTSELATLGVIQAIPEDWRINQHGVFLMLDTYYLTKEEMGYEGSMGQFLVDVFRFYRLFMQYATLPEVGPVLLTEKEVSDDGRGEEASGGAGVPEPGDGEDFEEGEREG